MARKCGVCKRAPREGEEMRPVRFREEDLEDFEGLDEAGLYATCLECTEKKRSLIAERKGCDPSSVSNYGLL